MKDTKLKLLVGTNTILDYKHDNKAVIVGDDSKELVKTAVANFLESADNPYVNWYSNDKSVQREFGRLSSYPFNNLALKHLTQEQEARQKAPKADKICDLLIVAPLNHRHKILDVFKDSPNSNVNFLFYSEKSDDVYAKYKDVFSSKLFIQKIVLNNEVALNSEQLECIGIPTVSNVFNLKSDVYVRVDNLQVVDTFKVAVAPNTYHDHRLGRLMLKHPSILSTLSKLSKLGVNLTTFASECKFLTGGFATGFKLSSEPRYRNDKECRNLLYEIEAMSHGKIELTEIDLSNLQDVLGVSLQSLMKVLKVVVQKTKENEVKERYFVTREENENWNKIPLGIKDNGDSLYWDVLEDNNALVTGITGGGKTNLLKNIIAFCSKSCDWNVTVVDFQGDLTRDLSGDICSDYSDTLYSISMLKDHIERVVEDLTAKNFIKDGKLVNGKKWECKHRHLLVIDELAEVFSPIRDKKTQESKWNSIAQIDILENFKYIIEYGHLAGVYTVMSAQRPDKSILPDELRPYITFRIASGMLPTTIAEMVFDDNEEIIRFWRENWREKESRWKIFIKNTKGYSDAVPEKHKNN